MTVGGRQTEAAQTPRVILVACAIGFALRLLLLGSKTLWLDEVLSIRTARAGLDAWLAGSVGAYHPPLYYVLLGPWLEIASTPFLLRLPSAVIGTFCIPLSYRLAMRLSDRETATKSMWLVALSPLLIWYSQELRSYALLVMLSLLATVLLLEVLEHPTVTAWLGYCLSVVARLYLHYDAILLGPVHFLLAVGMLASSRTTLRKTLAWIVALVVAGLAFVPWLLTPSMQRFLAIVLSDQLYVLPLLERTVGFGHQLIVPVAALGILISLAGLTIGIWRLIRHRSRALTELRSHRLVQALTILLYVILLVLSVLPRGYTVKRHILVAWVPVLVGFAWIWSGLARRRLVWIAIVVLSVAASLTNIIAIPKPQWREVAQVINTGFRQGDVVLLSPSYMGIP
ncbi:MAG: glycosyltransferase family 39 protein, partial [Anaerolineae bacterium]|nr:glycosyltransferase family 39 protein [Anaerolineae bacterium]